ncbi:MAG: 2-dehydropantoate 2-reductase [bacterium]
MTPPAPGRIVVAGAGAVGSLLAAVLARGLEEGRVWLAGRTAPSPETAAHLEEAAREGIAVEGAAEFTARPGVIRGPEGGAADFLLLAVKAGQLADAAREFSPLAGPRTRVAVLSNGLDVCADLPPAMRGGGVVRALVMTGAERTGPGRVRQSGALSLILAPAFAEKEREAGMKAAQELAAALARAGARAEVRPDGREEEWRKAMVNLVVNPLGALLGLRNGALLETAHAAALFRTLAGEAQRVTEAEGFDIDVLALAEAAARATAGNRNSMWQDLLLGRETEIDALTGRFLAHAEAAGVEAPVHWAMYQCIRELEEKGREGG